MPLLFSACFCNCCALLPVIPTSPAFTAARLHLPGDAEWHWCQHKLQHAHTQQARPLPLPSHPTPCTSLLLRSAPAVQLPSCPTNSKHMKATQCTVHQPCHWAAAQKLPEQPTSQHITTSSAQPESYSHQPQQGLHSAMLHHAIILVPGAATVLRTRVAAAAPAPSRCSRHRQQATHEHAPATLNLHSCCQCMLNAVHCVGHAACMLSPQGHTEPLHTTAFPAPPTAYHPNHNHCKCWQ